MELNPEMEMFKSLCPLHITVTNSLSLVDMCFMIHTLFITLQNYKSVGQNICPRFLICVNTM